MIVALRTIEAYAQEDARRGSAQLLGLNAQSGVEQRGPRFVAASGHKQVLVAQPGKPFEACDIFDAHDTEPAERFNFESFHRAIQTGERVPNDGRDNLGTLAVVDAFIRSAREGHEVPVTNCG